MGKKIDRKCGTFRELNGKIAVNYCLYATSFALTHNCRAMLSRPVILRIMAKFCDIATRVNPTSESSLRQLQDQVINPGGLATIVEEDEAEEKHELLEWDKVCEKIEKAIDYVHPLVAKFEELPKDVIEENKKGSVK